MNNYFLTKSKRQNKMNNYFDLIPHELILEIFNYVNDYIAFVTLSELSNLSDNTIKNYIKNNLYKKIPIVADIIIPNYNADIRYLISSYLVALRCYKESEDFLNYMITETNAIIQEYYPEATIDNFDEYNLDDYKIHDIINEYSFEMIVKISFRLPIKVMELIKRKFRKDEYEMLLKDLSVDTTTRILLLVNQNGLSFALKDLNDDTYDMVDIDYNEMLMVIFTLNYNISINYVRNNMKRINE